MQKDFLIGFIEIYRQNTCLWKMKSENYSNKISKKKAYKALVDYSKGKLDDQNVDTNWVKKKIKIIRNSFRKEYKKVEASKRSGENEIHEPKLWYYNRLLFTKDQEELSEGMDSLIDNQNSIQNQEDSETDDEETILPESASSSVQSVQSFKRVEPTSISQAPKRIKISRNNASGFDLDETRLSMNIIANTNTQTNNNKSDDQYDAFAKHVSAQLRELPLRSFIILQGQIQDLINRERLALLSEQEMQQQQYDCIPSTSYSQCSDFSHQVKEEISTKPEHIFQIHE
ncbi:uncharacterized protein LOC123672443 isoform X1 [Harmonia axyridis]|uniref:uncharacterized protein LOC123672443 isoform X1 n=1 Tax=Harmonia axyridis TaxID=115357 RepID=UPI001E278D66|nr:uncharacterized protein LOC123672443 isoform X1 [Harmonia axyridis]